MQERKREKVNWKIEMKKNGGPKYNVAMTCGGGWMFLIQV